MPGRNPYAPRRPSPGLPSALRRASRAYRGRSYLHFIRAVVCYNYGDVTGWHQEMTAGVYHLATRNGVSGHALLRHVSAEGPRPTPLDERLAFVDASFPGRPDRRFLRAAICYNSGLDAWWAEMREAVIEVAWDTGQTREEILSYLLPAESLLTRRPVSPN